MERKKHSLKRGKPLKRGNKGLKPGKWRTSKHVILKRSQRKEVEAQWSRWNFEAYAEFIWPNITPAEIPQLIGTELPCEHCGISQAVMDADHAAIPRSNRLRGDPWDPANGQILCRLCNGEKGSIHNEEWDCRSPMRKIRQMQKASKEWVKVGNKWEYIGDSKFVLKGRIYGNNN